MNHREWVQHWSKNAEIRPVNSGHFGFVVAVGDDNIVKSTFGLDIADEIIGLTINQMDDLLAEYNRSVGSFKE